MTNLHNRVRTGGIRVGGCAACAALVPALLNQLLEQVHAVDSELLEPDDDNLLLGILEGKNTITNTT